MFNLNGQCSDAELARAVRAGQPAAYAMLADRHLKAVYALALRVVGNAADAEDIAQETFLHALERLDQYDPAYSFRNWVLKTATNLALGLLRSRRRRERLHRQAAKADVHQADFSDVAADEKKERAWQGLLERLDDDQRTAIVLFHFQELPYAQVAEVMDVPINTVRTLIHRGRHRLREWMTKDPSVSECGLWTAEK